VRLKWNDSDIDACRPVIVEMFGTKHSAKTKEIAAAVAKATKITMRPATYNHIMKELASSSGSSWVLKDGVN
jgi:hypothetical protein